MKTEAESHIPFAFSGFALHASTSIPVSLLSYSLARSLVPNTRAGSLTVSLEFLAGGSSTEAGNEDGTRGGSWNMPGK